VPDLSGLTREQLIEHAATEHIDALINCIRIVTDELKTLRAELNTMKDRVDGLAEVAHG